MRTNKINVKFNMDNIDKDFDIFIVEKDNKDYYKNNILDLAIYEFKAKAVQWTYGAKALVLFDKRDGMTKEKLKSNIGKEYKDVKVQKIDLTNEVQCKNCFYFQNRLLVQLLLNSINMPEIDGFKYNNLTGKLFYFDPSWIVRDKITKEINVIRFLEIFIDPGMYLNLYHKTFIKCNNEAKGSYVIDPKTGNFRKKLKTDEDCITYKAGSLPGVRFTVDNFNVTDYNHFEKSKMGILYKFLIDVSEKLSKYMSIEFMERENQEFEIPRIEKKGITDKDYGKMLQKRGVVIVDENETDKSRYLIENILQELKDYFGITATVGNLSKDAYNIRVIHNSEYYAKKELNDPHNKDLKGYIVQHITEEADLIKDKKGSSPAIKKVVQELIIKGDVRERFISIFDWAKLNYGKEWAFVIRKKISSKNDDNKKNYKYYRLKISISGELTFDTYCDIDSDKIGEWSEICFAYNSELKKQSKINVKVDGLLYSDINNIHVILSTCEKTLPNVMELGRVLKETDNKKTVPTEIIFKAFNDFEKENLVSKDVISVWRSKLSVEEETITKGKLKKILNFRSSDSWIFNRYLHHHYGIWIDGELRKNEFEATYQIGNLVNIKYDYIENDYTDGNAFMYYVGAKSKDRKYPNACCIRRVISFGDEIEFEKLLRLMTVDFVRNGQYTVIPFPFKYLREYVAQCENYIDDES